ncbi:prepilin-type N-terminal cleavage/methylation domain-containing protein [Planctomycetota bacterium]
MKNRTQQHKGFTIVEVLLALTISALLLTAVATAFNASVTNYQENLALYESVNGARQALTRMTAELGRCLEVTSVTADACTFTNADSEEVIYEFEDENDRIVLTKGGKSYDLCTNVTTANFDFEQKALDDGGSKCTGVRINLTVSAGHTEKTMASAVAIRRQLDW